MQKTLIRRIEQHRDRWSSYGAGTGIIDISEKLSAAELKRFEIFKEYDEKFLEQISPDVSVANWRRDAVLFEEGSFVDVAFYIVEGEVAVYINKLQEDAGLSGPIYSTLLTVGGEPPTQSRQGPAVSSGSVHYQRSQALESRELTFLSVMDFDLPGDAAQRLGKGEFFGEIGALNGWPQSVTARTLSNCLLVQIRLPALRLMKRKSKVFKKHIDDLYRERSLFQQLKVSPLFRGCSDGFLIRLTGKVGLVSCKPNEVVMEEGEPVDSLYLVRSGFMKLAQRVGEGEIAASYLSKGMTVGEVELLLEGVDNARFTVSSVGYSELVKISREDFSRILEESPETEKELWKQAVSRIKQAGYSKRIPEHSEFVQFSLDKGLVEGNSILVIDLSVCTRCDDCVRACSDTHGGRPRFVREGDRYENVLITKACYHCQDPVCLIGCPTGAIRRANVGEVVEIKENICIGCSTCANNCPYDAIVMHETGLTWPDDALPKSLRGKDRQVASKCDLCYTSTLGPACVRNCPHGCAYRVGSAEEYQQLLLKGD